MWNRFGAVLTDWDERLRRDEPDRRAVLILSAILALLLLVWTAAKLPISGGFELFLNLDYGANLTLQRLLDAGKRPNVDFVYSYGLLPLALGRVWFGLLGLEPWAYLALVAVFQVFLAALLARGVAACRAGLLGAVFAMAALPFTFPATYPNTTHGLEAVLMMAGLVAQARGRLDRALFWATLALFTKPSMAYFYGAILLAMIVSRHGRAWRETLRAILPAMGALIALTAGSLAWVGPVALRGCLLPFDTVKIYRAAGYGFFHGSGRNFWLPPHPGLWHYLGTPRGYWIAASLGLLAAAWILLDRRIPAGRNRAIVVTAALLHAAFVCLFFGNDTFWLHYAYLLTLGMLALAGISRRGRRVVLLLAILALAADRSLPREAWGPWSEVGLKPRVHGLWTTAAMARDWRALLDQIQGERPVYLAYFSNAEALEPERFDPATDFCMFQGMEDSPEARTRAARIRAANVVVLPGPALLPGSSRAYLLEGFPPITSALADFEPSGGNDRFTVLRRKPSAPIGRNPHSRP